jgi:pimeloyl-ACP methyl ester carboxylesterase
VGVRSVDSSEVRAERLQNVLTNGRMSTASSVLLQQRGLEDVWLEQPEAALAVLHEGVLDSPQRAEVLASLAELSYLLALRTESKERYLATVVYAWLVLFPEDLSLDHSRLDPRRRLMADLYNGALADALLPPDHTTLTGLESRHLLPFGSIDLRFDPDELDWGQHRLASFEHADGLRVRGLRNRHFRPGLGSSLVGTVEPLAEQPRVHVPNRVRVPATLVLQLDDAEAQFESGELSGELSLYVMDETREITIHGRRIPLEYDSSVALASALDRSTTWNNELTGLLQGDFRATAEEENGLILLHPHHAGRIPLVLVHGTASSPGRWADLVNDVWNAPAVADHYQIWLFIYPSGNPVVYSARQLRDALNETVAFLDPEGEDPALEQIVIAGHSQGGLLSRVLVVHSEDHLWRGIAGEFPFDELDLQPEARSELEQLLFFEPFPHVTRAVFLATPHRGSRLVQPRNSALASRLIGLPADLVSVGQDLLLDPKAKLKIDLDIDNLPTSIENMRPGSIFMDALEQMPVEVPHHTIAGVIGGGPHEEGDDGVVDYTSAHLETAESELVVDSPHSLQAHPAVIQEMLRILELHLIESGLGATEAPPAAPIEPDAQPEDPA